jgi:hypothetical protein
MIVSRTPVLMAATVGTRSTIIFVTASHHTREWTAPLNPVGRQILVKMVATVQRNWCWSVGSIVHVNLAGKVSFCDTLWLCYALASPFVLNHDTIELHVYWLHHMDSSIKKRSGGSLKKSFFKWYFIMLAPSPSHLSCLNPYAPKLFLIKLNIIDRLFQAAVNCLLLELQFLSNWN